MRTYTYLLICVMIAFYSCTNKSNSNLSHLTDIIITPSDIEPSFDIANYISDEFDIIALETNEECLIAGINDVIYINEKYYILDKQTSSIFVFDSQGKYISKLFKKGEGPDEYTSLDAFVVIGNDIWISDTNIRVLIGYNSNFDLIKKINLWDKMTVNDLAVMDNYICMASNWSGLYDNNIQLGLYGIHNEEMKGLIYVPEIPEYAARFTKTSQLSMSGDSCLFIYSYCDSIFQIKHDSVIPQYRIAFKERYKDIPYSIEDYINPDKGEIIKGIEDIKQINNNILLGYIDNGIFISAVYNIDKNQSQSYSHLSHSGLGNMKIFQYAIYINDDYILSTYELTEVFNDKQLSFIPDFNLIENEEDKKKIEQVVSGLNMESNPILVKFKLK